MTTQTSHLLGKYAIIQDNQPKTKPAPELEDAVEKVLRKKGFHAAPAVDVTVIDERPETEKLENITESSHKPLMTATSVFPFELFPSTIDIDREKVTIVHRSFFRIASTFSLQIQDLQVVTVDVGPIFGSVSLASKFFIDNLQTINYLHRKDAVRVQRLLQGFIIAFQRNIDCSKIERGKLLELLDDLGQGSSS